MPRKAAAVRAMPRQKPASRMPGYEARRQGLRVNDCVEVMPIEPYFLPLLSAPQDALFTFGYEVTFKNTGAEPVWLCNRNWLITNENGNQFDVFGPTVAGQESFELPPHSTKSYKSAVPLDAPTNYRMKGYFEGSNAPDGAGAAFVTKEKEFNLGVSNDAVAKCLRYRANADFAVYAEAVAVKRLREALRDYEKTGTTIDTRNLGLIDRAALLEFERLLLKRFLIGYGERSISLHDIHPSFPAKLDIWDMACLALDGAYGVQILKHPRGQKAGAEPRNGYSVDNVVYVDFALNNPPLAKPKQEAYNPPVMPPPPDIGDATLEQAQSHIGEAIGKVGFAAVAKMIVEAASRDDRALLAGMAAHELTQPAAAPAPQSFAAALEAMTLAERKAALAKHYGAELDKKTGLYVLPHDKKWEAVRGANPTPKKFLAWLDAVFPDRREVGMVLSDLKYLSQRGYEKVMEWSSKGSKVPRVTIDAFGLPTKTVKFDPARDADAPKTRHEIYERALRGEDSYANLNRRYSRARRHSAQPAP